jgi:hypothetical protein
MRMGMETRLFGNSVQSRTLGIIIRLFDLVSIKRGDK